MRMCKKLFLGLVLCGAVLAAPFASQAGVLPAPSAKMRMPAPSQSEQSYLAENEAAETQALVPSPSGSQEYVLGTGDRIKLTVYGEADLSGEYEVSSTGVVAMPLIGDVHAAGQPLQAFEQAVRQKLTGGYLRDPRVSAQVVNYRPFFILGEVAKPGSYPYVNGMTIINAVALAGGYTYRADKKGVTASHANDPQKQDTPVTEETVVRPGDIIRVPERFF